MGKENSKHQQGVTVANESGEVIYAKVEREQKYTTHFEGGVEIQGLGYGVGANASRAYDWLKVKPGFSKILNEKHIRFEVVTQKWEQVYISIVSEDGDILIDALQKTSPCGLKVLPDGSIVDVEKGNHIWTEVRQNVSTPIWFHAHDEAEDTPAFLESGLFSPSSESPSDSTEGTITTLIKGSCVSNLEILLLRQNELLEQMLEQQKMINDNMTIATLPIGVSSGEIITTPIDSNCDMAIQFTNNLERLLQLQIELLEQMLQQ